jgi:hypothetical protein
VTAGGDPSLKKPSQAQQLQFYAWFKQIEKGKNTEKQPGRYEQAEHCMHSPLYGQHRYMRGELGARRLSSARAENIQLLMFFSLPNTHLPHILTGCN